MFYVVVVVDIVYIGSTLNLLTITWQQQKHMAKTPKYKQRPNINQIAKMNKDLKYKRTADH